MKPDDLCDVVVIGGGASGAAVSMRLAERGISVICLEQGGWVDPESLPKRHHDWELRGRRYWSPRPNDRRWPSDYSVRSVGATEVDAQLYNAVGGSTIGFGGIYWRLLPSDFRTKTLDGFGVDWPITYTDLEPYYDQNESILGVAGLSGDPTGPSRGPYPSPPVAMGKLGELWARGFEELGWYWWPQDCAITTREYGPDRGVCRARGFCGWGCPSRALGTVDVAYWPAALRAGVDLRTNCRVREISVDRRGLVDAVRYVDASDTPREARPKAVVVSCGGIGTPRLLLMSRSSKFPDGLANSSGLVGRNLMLHVHARVIARFPERVQGDHGSWGGTVSSRHFYETRPGAGFKRGFTIGGRRGLPPLETALRAAPWGSDHHGEFEAHLNHEGVLAVMGDDEPEPQNCIDLDWDNLDGAGLPGVKVAYRLSANSLRLGEAGIRRARELCSAAGAIDTWDSGLEPVIGFHLMGTARMGNDPTASVVDSRHRTHDVPNLFLVDGSSMPTGGAVNPTNTIQSLALRAADGMAAIRSELGFGH